MSATHLKFIAIGLAVLLLLWGGSELFSRGSDTLTGSLSLPALAQGDVDSVTLTKGTDSVVLAKQPSTGWTVNGHRAAAARVSDLFLALKDTVRPEIVAQDSSSFARLHVDSASGQWLRWYHGGKPALVLVLGARGGEFGTVYLRRPGDTHVYLWHGGLADVAARSAEDWRDKRIAALVPDSIAALEVERGKDRYTLTRAAKAWTVNGAATDSAAVGRYLQRLKTIDAAGFATVKQVDSMRTVRPTRRLVVRGRGAEGGVLLTLAFDSVPGGFLVRHLAGVGGEGATVYRMNTWDVDGLTPTSPSLKPAAPATKPAKK